jgi:hypothetical protein
LGFSVNPSAFSALTVMRLKEEKKASGDKANEEDEEEDACVILFHASVLQY